MKLIKFYSVPAIGFPFLKTSIRGYRIKDRGFGIWLHHRDYLSSTLRLGFWWVFEIEILPFT